MGKPFKTYENQQTLEASSCPPIFYFLSLLLGKMVHSKIFIQAPCIPPSNCPNKGAENKKIIKYEILPLLKTSFLGMCMQVYL